MWMIEKAAQRNRPIENVVERLLTMNAVALMTTSNVSSVPFPRVV